jgi:hypothetical protein
MVESWTETLLAAVRESGMSLREIGRRADVPYTSLSRLVSGERASIRLAVAEKIGAALGLQLVARESPATAPQQPEDATEDKAGQPLSEKPTKRPRKRQTSRRGKDKEG